MMELPMRESQDHAVVGSKEGAALAGTDRSPCYWDGDACGCLSYGL